MFCRLLLLPALMLSPQLARAQTLAERLKNLGDDVIQSPGDLAEMLSRDVRARRDAANLRDLQAWRKLKDRADWEQFRKPRLAALRQSLGAFPTPPKDLQVHITGKYQGDGYRIDNLVFLSRPGLVVTANLYSPARPGSAMPGILICHSHHNPKTEAELQDMGVNWARQGCVVLVMDQLGHGERRQHPFVDAQSYPKSFRVGRQDYYFRYNTAAQLYLVGDSLMGWMTWDLSRGVDLLLSRPGVDRSKIILLGSVAGGGDPAAVTAALDERIAVAVPFNFGGPQPETTYPLPQDAERRFNYVGGGSWESTRNLRLSARDGFLPWVIVGSVAPRRLIYAHEFAWDRDNDPVWKRFQTIWRWYEQSDRLAFTHGRGKLSGRPPESTHCNNIGFEHRKLIHVALKKWFDIVTPEKELRERRSARELACLTPDVAKKLGAKPLHVLLDELAGQRLDSARKSRQLRQGLEKLLGDITPAKTVKEAAKQISEVGALHLERLLLQAEPGIQIPAVLLLPKRQGKQQVPLLVGFCQAGKAEFLRRRSDELSALLEGGIGVCLIDVRGTGQTRVGSARGRQSAATSLAATELMLGQTVLGGQLRDLRNTLVYLRSRADIDPKRLVLWGESLAPVNGPDAAVAVPLDADQPRIGEPGAALLALLGGLFEDEVRAVVARGGLPTFRSVLRSQFFWLPMDCIVPGLLTVGDVDDLAAALAPRALWLESFIDGQNRAVSADSARKELPRTMQAYEKVGKLSFAGDLAAWLKKML